MGDKGNLDNVTKKENETLIINSIFLRIKEKTLEIFKLMPLVISSIIGWELGKLLFF